MAKGELNVAVHLTRAGEETAGGDEFPGVGSTGHAPVDVRHFDSSDLRDLFVFRPRVPRCDTFEAMRGRWADDDDDDDNGSATGTKAAPAAAASPGHTAGMPRGLVADPALWAAVLSLGHNSGQVGAAGGAHPRWAGPVSYVHVMETPSRSDDNDEDKYGEILVSSCDGEPAEPEVSPAAPVAASARSPRGGSSKRSRSGRAVFDSDSESDSEGRLQAEDDSTSDEEVNESTGDEGGSDGVGDSSSDESTAIFSDSD